MGQYVKQAKCGKTLSDCPRDRPCGPYRMGAVVFEASSRHSLTGTVPGCLRISPAQASRLGFLTPLVAKVPSFSSLHVVILRDEKTPQSVETRAAEGRTSGSWGLGLALPLAN